MTEYTGYRVSFLRLDKESSMELSSYLFTSRLLEQFLVKKIAEWDLLAILKRKVEFCAGSTSLDTRVELIVRSMQEMMVYTQNLVTLFHSSNPDYGVVPSTETFSP